jgi:hypothetical protein
MHPQSINEAVPVLDTEYAVLVTSGSYSLRLTKSTSPASRVTFAQDRNLIIHADYLTGKLIDDYPQGYLLHSPAFQRHASRLAHVKHRIELVG